MAVKQKVEVGSVQVAGIDPVVEHIVLVLREHIELDRALALVFVLVEHIADCNFATEVVVVVVAADKLVEELLDLALD